MSGAPDPMALAVGAALRGEVVIVLGYTEPGSGSDVAAARMRGLATPDALSHAASGIHGVLVRTAERGTEEMRIVESAGVMLDPRPRFAAVALPAS